MTEPLAELIRLLTPDPWRVANGFSIDIQEVNQELWQTDSKHSIHQILVEWLARYQPCLFGKVAAKASAITTCILLESEILQHDDLRIRSLIQERRTQWTLDGFFGKSSAFILVVISENLANALPDENMLNFAKRLASLYLLKEPIECDELYHDETFLESARGNLMTWKWLAGVNYFSAAGDKRWWHDHRFPGGIAFSVNSVGHLVKSGILSRLGSIESGLGNPYIDSLPKALEWAMRTIDAASATESGKATYLINKSVDTPPPPIPLPPAFEFREHRHYKGYYHTDQTLPSEYFVPDVARNASIQPLDLDFTYLFESKVSNPDYVLMGEGRRIRSSEINLGRADGQEVEIASCTRLMAALGR